jgi:hypothetical protein
MTLRAPARRLAAGGYAEQLFSWRSRAGLIRATSVLVAFAFVVGCAWIAKVEPGKLIEGLPRLLKWAATDWPPKRPALIRSPSLWLGRAARAP